MARSVAEGALKVGSSIVKNPVEYTKNFFKGLASGPLDIGSFLIQEDIKLQKLESSFESLDPKKMDNAALMYYKEHQGQVKAFAEAMKKIKSMSLNEVCKKSGELGMDLLAGSFYFKGLALLAKGADVANAAFKKTDELFMAMKNEKVIAGGSNVLGSSEEFIKSVSVTTKVAMEEGAEVGETIGKKSSSLFEQNEKLHSETMQNLSNDDKISTDQNFEASKSQSYDIPDNVALYPKLKDDLAVKQVTSVTNATKHGVQRLLERGFSPEEIIALKNSPDIVMTQKDGAKVLIKILGDKYNVIVEGNEGVITSLKNISQKSLDKLTQNYDWKK